MLDTISYFITTQIPQGLLFVRESRWTQRQSMSPLMWGIFVQVCFILLIILLVRLLRNTKVWTTITLLYDSMYEFFEEILGENEKRGVKIYIISLFFIILTSNVLSYTIDLIRVMFTDIESIFRYIEVPTTNFSFNIALAVTSVVIMLAIQLKHLNPIKFILEYIPITGKWILDIERGNMAARQYYPAKVVVKLADIGISLFVWFLDIVGIAAKVLSLSARLYGNMLAWGILLWLLVVWVNGLSQNIWSVDFPVLAPLVLYAQGLLVTGIQAFVFPLLVAIFIKIAQWND